MIKQIKFKEWIFLLQFLHKQIKKVQLFQKNLECLFINLQKIFDTIMQYLKQYLKLPCTTYQETNKNTNQMSTVLNQSLAFIPTQCLFTAVELDLYTILSAGPLTAKEIVQECGLHGRGVEDFLDTLVAVDLLACEGLGEQRTYKNTHETAQLLDKKQQDNIVQLVFFFKKKYEQFIQLAEGLRSGEPQRKGSSAGFVADDKEALVQFARLSTGATIGSYRKLLEVFDFSKYYQICDMGGALGGLIALIANKYPSVKCINADLPALKEASEEYLEEQGVSSSTSFVGLDFLNEDLPKADAFIFGNVLHMFGLDAKKMILKKAYGALPSGGVCIVCGSFIDDERKKFVKGLSISLLMLMELPGGFDFTFTDLKGWMAEVGFGNFQQRDLVDASHCVVGYKP
eukprot:TRINITY_DN2374_c0_g1_i9.p1 TRINITY_DN2374_c0_g1~~TRINITY_DN2374_c0_g1_i9.p1  ORF type:complete len:400 (-),score=33.76 TRINITY_DN2374_c0_g1_i9:1451-2650(-)